MGVVGQVGGELGPDGLGLGAGPLISISVFGQNLLGLQNIPRQFFLQVYHTFLRIAETRYPGLCSSLL